MEEKQVANVETMTEAELDAELRSHGLDPQQVVQNCFNKICVLAKTQAERIRALEAELREAREKIARLSAPVSDAEWDLRSTLLPGAEQHIWRKAFNFLIKTRAGGK
jgi:hypothetical protein